MPDFTYCGLTARMYPELRDAYGVLLGTVKPGDVARLDEAPDQWWVPYEAGESVPQAGPAEPATPEVTE